MHAYTSCVCCNLLCNDYMSVQVSWCSELPLSLAVCTGENMPSVIQTVLARAKGWADIYGGAPLACRSNCAFDGTGSCCIDTTAYPCCYMKQRDLHMLPLWQFLDPRLYPRQTAEQVLLQCAARLTRHVGYFHGMAWHLTCPLP